MWYIKYKNLGRVISLKKFIAGLVVGALLTGTVSFAAVNLTAIKSHFLTTVNGKGVKQDIVTINGTYYADMKQLAGNLGIKYVLDTKGKKFNLGEASEENKYSMNNPAPIGTKQTIYSSFYKADITINELVRGDKAWDLIKKIDDNKLKPEKGYEFILAKIKFDLKDIEENRALFIFNGAFSLVSEIGEKYEPMSITELPIPTINAALFKGESNEGWVIFKVKSNDKKPLITYGTQNDGTGGIWFKAY